MNPRHDAFSRRFKALTGFEPFPWQRRIHERLVEGAVPPACDIPTGLGKTSVIHAWLLAIVSRLERGLPLAGPDRTSLLPRRLVYVVHRRTIVDQATDVATSLRHALSNASELEDVRQLLRRLSSDPETLLAISTLRGALADNREWRHDPARPAIIIGTVDMIGSKLLFSGYGSSYKARPHEAGLLGQDALVVHDEAHLTPTFGSLLRAVRREQVASGDPRPLQVMELTATQRDSVEGEPLELGDDDRVEAEIERRITARKRLAIEQADDVAAAIAQRALDWGARGPSRILVFVRRPSDAQKIVRALRKAKIGGDDVKLLTGTLRGMERDELAESALYKSFKPRANRPDLERSLYLVATSAGEVGIDIDADHLACDLTTLDGMIQRLGRVNRLGHGDARVDVFVPGRDGKRPGGKKPGEMDARLAATLEALGSLPELEGGRDASPLSLRRIAGIKEALSEAPRVVPLTDIHLDRWSMTSILGAMPGREPVQPFLHGVVEDVIPDTHVAWRADLDLLDAGEVRAGAAATGARSARGETELARALEAFPLATRETLRSPTRDVAEALLEIADRLANLDEPRVLRIAVSDEGTWRWASIAPADGAARDRVRRDLEAALRWKQIVIPASAGGLSEGLLDASSTDGTCDVADAHSEGEAAENPGCRRYRVLLTCDDDEWSLASVQGLALPEKLRRLKAPTDADLLRQIEDETSCSVVLRLPLGDGSSEGTTRILAYLVEAGADIADLSESEGAKEQSLAFHLGAAERHALDLSARAELGSLGGALATAARCHDLGKARRHWQEAIGNRSERHLAKTRHARFDHRKCGGYRHELGSLHDIQRDASLGALPDRDLVLHLVASHHGRARPHFERRAFDRERTTAENEALAAECIDRFEKVSARHGRWGLAWLEALHHAADVHASLEQEMQAQAEGA